MTQRRQTPSQTVGPFFAFGLTPEQYNYDFASIADGRMIDGDVPASRNPTDEEQAVIDRLDPRGLRHREVA